MKSLIEIKCLDKRNERLDKMRSPDSSSYVIFYRKVAKAG